VAEHAIALQAGERTTAEIGHRTHQQQMRQRIIVEPVDHVPEVANVSRWKRLTAFTPGTDRFDADPADIDALADGVEHIEEQACPVFDRAPVHRVRTLVRG